MTENYWGQRLTDALENRQRQILDIEREKINRLLKIDLIARHFINDLARAMAVRVLGKNTEPSFLIFISQIFSTVYDPDDQSITEKDYCFPHNIVAQFAKKNVNFVFSGDTVCFQAEPKTKVLIFSNPAGINSSDLRVLYKAGYLPMDEYYRWMVFNPQNPEEILRLSSPVTPPWTPKILD